MGLTTGVLLLALLGVPELRPSGVAATTGSAGEPSLCVRLSSGKATYAMGEVIRLDLEFTGRADSDFYWSTETYDRSGRLASETYELVPGEGFDDPLDDYFRGDIFGGFIGGGLRGLHSLDGSPFRLQVVLNEWVRFTRPGRYEVLVSSHRLQRHSLRPAPVVSADPVVIDIVSPPKSWAEREVERATVALRGANGDEARQGVAVLRHLGTKGAALALLANYPALDERANFDLLAGLIASPHRALIVEEMESKVDAGAPLPASFVERLSYLRCLLEMPRGTGDYASRRARYEALRKEYDARWMSGSAKRGWTEKELGAALRKLNVDLDAESASAIAEALAQNPKQAAAAFLAVPPAQQSYLLEYQWPMLDRPWVRPALEALYNGWTGEPGGTMGAGDLALKRIFELDPDQGQRLALDEIATGRRRIGFPVLSVLADDTRPDLDASLRRRLERGIGDSRADYFNRQTAAWLVWRYGSPGMLPFVTEALEGPARACGVRAALLAYLLDHEAESALRRLRPGPEGDATVACILWEIAPRVWDERLESAAIARLAGRDIDEVADIARVLGQYGSARVREPLLERLARWEGEWRGRGAELVALRSGRGPWPERIENALTNALFENPRLTLSAEDKSRIRALCVTEECRSNLEARIRPPRQ